MSTPLAPILSECQALPGNRRSGQGSQGAGAFKGRSFVLKRDQIPRRPSMSLTDMLKPTQPLPNSPVAQIATETAAVTRLLEAEGMLDYSGHVSPRIPGRDAFVIQIGSTSRAEVEPGSMPVCDYDGNVLEGDGAPPSELPIHTKVFRARPDVQSVRHSHMELAIAFTMMEGEAPADAGARLALEKRHPDGRR